MNSSGWYPLRFQPLLRRYVWGGRRLGSRLGKPIGDETCAESWEVCDHHDDQSVVAAGALAGRTLQELVTKHGEELLGQHHPQPRFPLLLKFLDAQEALSVQVHPDDRRAAQLDPPQVGKTEAWLVLEAAPGSVLYAGLKCGVDRSQFERELAGSTAEICLHQVQPRAGDCLLLPAGAVHALGRGLLIAELQQPSDVTYRLYDWGRVDAAGNPRTLHIPQALECIDWNLGPLSPAQPQPDATKGREQLAACEKFVWDRWRIETPTALGGDRRAHVVALIEGSATAAGDATQRPLGPGDTLLLPAALGPVPFTPSPHAVLLDAYLP